MERCLEMAANDISNGSATSVTAMSSSSNIVMIARRVGSDNAANVESIRVFIGLVMRSAGKSSTDWLNIPIAGQLPIVAGQGGVALVAPANIYR